MEGGLFGLYGSERRDELFIDILPPIMTPTLSPVPNKPYVASVELNITLIKIISPNLDQVMAPVDIKEGACVPFLFRFYGRT